MLIKDKETNKVLDFSKYLYCTSSSVKVSSTFHNFNSIHGQLYKQNSSTMGSRTFTITGNFEAGSSHDVERFRGVVFKGLFNKPLLLFLDDDDVTYYECVLDGNVNTTYNIGWQISKVFTLSFNLVAALPYAYGNINTFNKFKNGVSEYDIFYHGNVPAFCGLKMFLKRKIKVKHSDNPFIRCRDTVIDFKEGSLFSEASYYVREGLLFENGKNIADVLTKHSVFFPLMLTEGKNKIHVNWEKLEFDNFGSFNLVWQDIYF